MIENIGLFLVFVFYVAIPIGVSIYYRIKK